HVVAEQAVSYGRKALRNEYRLSLPLFAMARVELARENPAAAESLLREALTLRAQVHPPADPRMLEVGVTLAKALAAPGQAGEARAGAERIESRLGGATSPCLDELRARLRAP